MLRGNLQIGKAMIRIYICTYSVEFPRVSQLRVSHAIVAWSSLHWRHNDHDGVSNHQPHVCLLNRSFRRRSKKISKLCVTGLCVGNSPGPVNSPHKGPVTRKMFRFDDVIVLLDSASVSSLLIIAAEAVGSVVSVKDMPWSVHGCTGIPCWTNYGDTSYFPYY